MGQHEGNTYPTIIEKVNGEHHLKAVVLEFSKIFICVY